MINYRQSVFQKSELVVIYKKNVVFIGKYERGGLCCCPVK